MVHRYVLFPLIFFLLVLLLIVLGMDYKSRNVTEAAGGYEKNFKNETLKTEDKEALEHRIKHLKSVLDTLEKPRVRMPYYGEIIRVYVQLEQYDKAGRVALKRARLSEQASDWKESGDYFFEAATRTDSEDFRKDTARKAKSMYITALEIKPGDPEIKTDLAVVYMSLLEPEESFLLLENVLMNNPDHIRANFNMGVLMLQIGRASEAIPFFEHARDRSVHTEWEESIRTYLDVHHHDIYH
ncbi:hypothetical protein QLX67_06095 [Balneolaceae bacterium ANBcel3]|nr:hypothetical protein [Balneolaceae bacterium ANBcel3]